MRYVFDALQVMATQLKERLALALHEFRREKVVRQNARLSLMHAIYDNAALPQRKVSGTATAHGEQHCHLRQRSTATA